MNIFSLWQLLFRHQISDEELEDEGVKTTSSSSAAAASASVDAVDVDWAGLVNRRRERAGDAGDAVSGRQRWRGDAVLARLGVATPDGHQHPRRRTIVAPSRTVTHVLPSFFIRFT